MCQRQLTNEMCSESDEENLIQIINKNQQGLWILHGTRPTRVDPKSLQVLNLLDIFWTHCLVHCF